MIELEIKNYDTYESSFIVQDCFSYPEFFFLYMKLNIVLLRSINCVGIKLCWDFDGIALNFLVSFGKNVIFTMLILPIHEYERSFHFLIPSLIYFFKNLKFLSNKLFTCLVRVTPRYILLFLVVIKGVVSLIPFSAL